LVGDVRGRVLASTRTRGVPGERARERGTQKGAGKSRQYYSMSLFYDPVSARPRGYLYTGRTSTTGRSELKEEREKKLTSSAAGDRLRGVVTINALSPRRPFYYYTMSPTAKSL
jgi:hypothetical protein